MIFDLAKWDIYSPVLTEFFLLKSIKNNKNKNAYEIKWRKLKKTMQNKINSN